MGFGFMVLNVRVSPVKSRVLNDVKVTNVNCVLHGVWGVGVEKIFIESEGGRGRPSEGGRRRDYKSKIIIIVSVIVFVIFSDIFLGREGWRDGSKRRTLVKKTNLLSGAFSGGKSTGNWRVDRKAQVQTIDWKQQKTFNF